MRCPTLTELPSPPAGKTGWPWTEESAQLPATMPDGSPWPKVSIVTPSYNQGQFLEETIRSVLLQGYPNLEYIIMDGGSTDNSVEIIRKYEPWLAHWVSERDGGQADAIDKGWQIANGEIVAWLNSDDAYLSGVFSSAVFYIKDNDIAVVYGNALLGDEDGRVFQKRLSRPFDLVMEPNSFCPICQPASFVRAEAVRAIGGLNSSLQYTMDHDLWLRLSLKYRLLQVSDDWAMDRTWSGRKSVANILPFRQEVINTWQCFLSGGGVPQEILQVAPRIMAHAYLRAAIAAARENPLAIERYVNMLLTIAPTLICEKQTVISALSSDHLHKQPKSVELLFQAIIQQSTPDNLSYIKQIYGEILAQIWIDYTFDQFDRDCYQAIEGAKNAIKYNSGHLKNRGFLKRLAKCMWLHFTSPLTERIIKN